MRWARVRRGRGAVIDGSAVSGGGVEVLVAALARRGGERLAALVEAVLVRVAQRAVAAQEPGGDERGGDRRDQHRGGYLDGRDVHVLLEARIRGGDDRRGDDRVPRRGPGREADPGALPAAQ